MCCLAQREPGLYQAGISGSRGEAYNLGLGGPGFTAAGLPGLLKTLGAPPTSQATPSNSIAWPVKTLWDLAWPKPVGVVMVEPCLAGPRYKPYGISTGCDRLAYMQ